MFLCERLPWDARESIGRLLRILTVPLVRYVELKHSTSPIHHILACSQERLSSKWTPIVRYQTHDVFMLFELSSATLLDAMFSTCFRVMEDIVCYAMV